MMIRLILILILSSPALGQDQDMGQLIWDAGGTLLNLDAAVIENEAKVGGILWGAAGKAINSLTSTNEGTNIAEPTTGQSSSDGTVNPAIGGSASVGTVDPAIGGSASVGTVDPVIGGSAIGGTVDSIPGVSVLGKNVEQTNNLPPVDGSGSGSDTTVGLPAGETIEPTTGGENTAEQTNGLLKGPDEGTTKPSPNLLDDPNKAPTFQLSVTADQSSTKTSTGDECDLTNSRASLMHSSNLLVIYYELANSCGFLLRHLTATVLVAEPRLELYGQWCVEIRQIFKAH